MAGPREERASPAKRRPQAPRSPRGFTSSRVAVSGRGGRCLARRLVGAGRAGAEGPWGPEARLLFDLQKIGVDRERHVYAIDVWGWASSLGKKPLKRPLPCLAEVLIHRHLRSALRRMTAVRMADSSRRVLHGLLHRAEERSEANLRSRFRPLIADALRDAQLDPSNVVERVAARKLVEELIDRILDHGFLTLGDLRDAVARNNLKADDLSGPGDLVFGDQLLRADRKMAAALDGVYRHGQFYLRAMQRLSAVAFGTRTGRMLMRYLILPFGGAYVAEAGVQHLVALATRDGPGNPAPAGRGDLGPVPASADQLRELSQRSVETAANRRPRPAFPLARASPADRWNWRSCSAWSVRGRTVGRLGFSSSRWWSPRWPPGPCRV